MSTREERFRAMDAAVLRTIVDADWRAMFRRERAGVRNPVAEQIRKKILNQPTGISQSGNVRKTSTDL